MHAHLPNLLYRYRGGFNHIAAVAVVSRKGDLLAVNEKFTELYGYTEPEVLGHPISILRSPLTPVSTHETLWSSVLAGNPWSGEILNCRKTGEMVWVRSTITFIDQDDIQHSNAFLVMYQDINDEVVKRKSIVDREREEMRQGLLAGTLHNIGNLQTIVAASITNIRDSASNLAEACRFAKSKKDFVLQSPTNLESVLTIIEEQATKLQGLAGKGQGAIKKVNDVLESFREIQRNVRTVTSATPLTILRDAIESFSFQAATLRIQLTLGHHKDAIANREVVWPVKQLHQVLFNLIKNATEAIEIERKKNPKHVGRIDLAVENHPDSPSEFVVLSVRDNGGGFHVHKDEMFRHGVTTKRNGLGLGLHNSALLIQSMGGAITADVSALDGKSGARFRIVLPNEVSQRVPESSDRKTIDYAHLTPNLGKHEKLDRLTKVSSALSSNHESDAVLRMILDTALDVTNADGGTLYRISEDGERLILSISKTLSLGALYLEKSFVHPGFSSVPVRKNGSPFSETVAASAFNTRTTINIDNIDMAIAQGFDFAGTKRVDALTGYKTISLLTAPIVYRDKPLGVLQVINSIDPAGDKICAFSAEEQKMLEQLASHTALVLKD